MSNLPSCFSTPACFILPGIGIVATALLTVFGAHQFARRREDRNRKIERRDMWVDSLSSLVDSLEVSALNHFYCPKDPSEISHSAVLIVNGLKRIPEKVGEAEYSSSDAKDALLGDFRHFNDLVTGHKDFQNTQATFPISDTGLSEKINEVVNEIKRRARDHVDREIVFP